MDAPATTFWHARCACGQRYRVRNPQAGMAIRCPQCRQTVTLTEADLAKSALGGPAGSEPGISVDDSIIPIQKETVLPKEGVLLDYGELKVAPQDSQLGLTGRVTYSNEDALVASALSGGRLGVPTGNAGMPGAAASSPRDFVQDLFASFYFAGNRNNAMNLLYMVAGCAVIILLGGFMPHIFRLLMLPLNLLMILYILQFCWLVLNTTAAGQDEIPWFETDWNLWDDALKPLLWMTCIGVICSLPAWYVWRSVPDQYAWKIALFWAALACGWFFWPVAVMSAALGNSILFIRPDWLIRCVIAIGPLYLIAWIMILLIVSGWLMFISGNSPLAYVPIVGGLVFPLIVLSVTFYCGYVAFRILGLLFRHFRERFPWKY